MVKDMGNITYYLGIRVEQQDGSCTLTQDAYIDKPFATFKMELANEADTPGVPGQILSKQDCPETPEAKAEMEGKPYRQLVGSLMYGYCCTRPDIGSVLAKVASFCNNPGTPLGVCKADSAVLESHKVGQYTVYREASQG